MSRCSRNQRRQVVEIAADLPARFIVVMLGHTVMTVEESLRYFAKFADFASIEKEANEDEILQKNASRILEKGALGYVANLLYNPPGPLLDSCRT